MTTKRDETRRGLRRDAIAFISTNQKEEEERERERGREIGDNEER
jgi:hypothetical protein